MNLELFIKSLSEEEINELRELLKVEPEKLNKIPTFLEIYEKARESKGYYTNINEYCKKTKKRVDHHLSCKCLGVLHTLDVIGISPTTAKMYRDFHHVLIRITAGKTTIECIENWFEWYYKDFVKD